MFTSTMVNATVARRVLDHADLASRKLPRKGFSVVWQDDRAHYTLTNRGAEFEVQVETDHKVRCMKRNCPICEELS